MDFFAERTFIRWEEDFYLLRGVLLFAERSTFIRWEEDLYFLESRTLIRWEE